MNRTKLEDYVTETIFVKIYNRSKSFRGFVSKKFGEDKNFGDIIKFTGANKFNSDGYGHPDATSDIGNYIEVKTNYGTDLTDNEKKGGGYEKYLKENRDKLLLYVVPTDYDLSEAVTGKRVAHLYWQEIVDFLSEHNDTDPLIEKIYQKVEGVDMKNKKTMESYKANVYEVLARVISMNSAVQIDFDHKESRIKNFPYEENSYDGMIFTGNVIGEIWFFSDNIWLYPSYDYGRDKFYENNKKLKDNKIQTECNVQDGKAEAIKIISQNDFWEKQEKEVALIFNKVILEFQFAYNEIKLNELNS